ncbi:class IV aminotransferase [Corynebacterium suranareeae]|uniref:Class IV aminotransferase n=1 Tax=Corynebacterium suranareeae TaxID=2506452 RepID=A0A160PNG7_9CORY|nr:aminotransferase class IV [Corynebacterium suranareeae]BAU95379.1 class IV aminotransferase [Corynebacterium suranareeae]
MTYLVWDGFSLVEDDLESTPKVVDSYLVKDHQVVRWDLHEQRFARSIDSDPWNFLHEVRKAIPSHGSWFPKIEWHGGNDFAVQIRPAPALRETTSLWLSETPDPRTQPTIKGPDLDVLAYLRSRAVNNGCDDALLISADGFILEAANATVVFWADPQTVIVPSGEVLPSVTLAATIPLWHKAGIKVIYQNIRHIDFPAWCGSSLHGWTPVVSWGRGSGKFTAAKPPSVKPWNAQLRPTLHS